MEKLVLCANPCHLSRLVDEDTILDLINYLLEQPCSIGLTYLKDAWSTECQSRYFHDPRSQPFP